MAKTLVFRVGWFLSKSAGLLRLGFVAWIAGCLLLPVLGDEPARRKDPPTFTRDVAPILQKKCQNCHRSHHIGPFALETFEQARNAPRISPWWPLNDRCRPGSQRRELGQGSNMTSRFHPRRSPFSRPGRKQAPRRVIPRTCRLRSISARTGNWDRPTLSSSRPRNSPCPPPVPTRIVALCFPRIWRVIPTSRRSTFDRQMSAWSITSMHSSIRRVPRGQGRGRAWAGVHFILGAGRGDLRGPWLLGRRARALPSSRGNRPALTSSVRRDSPGPLSPHRKTRG